jgi:hypothetical protein
MTQGLVLYTTGKFEVKKFSSGKKFLKELNDCVGGRIEMLPVLRNYYNTEKKEKSERLLGYINEEGMFKNLPINPFSGLVQLLGAYSGSLPWYFGNIVLFLDGEKEKSISSYIISVVSLSKECEDEDEFYCALEKEQKEKTDQLHLVKRSSDEDEEDDDVETVEEEEEEEEEEL